ncbi:MAG: methyltransferase domain-containing protein, partial [Acidimicrobiales bacterium]
DAAVPARQRLLAALRCPRCRQALGDTAGVIACRAGHPVADGGGWLDLSGDAADAVTGRTFESFGYEWTTFSEIRPEDEGYWREYTADVPWDELTGAIGVDVGCGKGRYSRPTAQRLAGLVALDGSGAVAAAARNLGSQPNVVVVRTDLRDDRLAEGAFGFVSCLGVLHHLADPRAAFARIVRLLAPGGVLLVYLYSRPEGPGLRATALRLATTLRKATVRMPHRLLRPLCYPLAALLYGLVVVPGAAGERRGPKRLTGLPLEVYRGSPLRSLWLDTFDRLSAPLEHRFTWDEVRPWVDEAGLEVLAVRTWGGLMITARRR